MVESPSLTTGKLAPALCPRCEAPALFRSHTTSKLEEKRKQLGQKRPFRCHECGWRGWLEDASLRYSAKELQNNSPSAEQNDIDIPDISLETSDPAAGDPSEGARNRDGIHDGEDGNTDVPSGRRSNRKRHSGLGESVPLREEHLSAEEQPLDPRPHAQRRRTSAVPRSAQDRARDHGPGEDAELQDDLPEFDEGSGRPVSQKVSPGFHHSARHRVKACPKCSNPTLYRSRSRGIGEMFRKKFTNKRPYRCHKCGWRGWLTKGF